MWRNWNMKYQAQTGWEKQPTPQPSRSPGVWKDFGPAPEPAQTKYQELSTRYSALGKTCDVLGKRKKVLELENEKLRGQLRESRLEPGDAKSRALGFYHEGLELRTKYEELLYGVSKKYPGETQHATALRYIRQAETQDDRPFGLDKVTEEKHG
jgi:hypothetical protein